MTTSECESFTDASEMLVQAPSCIYSATFLRRHSFGDIVYIHTEVFTYVFNGTVQAPSSVLRTFSFGDTLCTESLPLETLFMVTFAFLLVTFSSTD